MYTKYMSTLTVEVVKVKTVQPHGNADRLDIITVHGWQVCAGRGKFQPGDLAVYFPIDSVLPAPVLAKLFGPDSKIVPAGGRIKTIRLRGLVSQGLAVAPEELGELLTKPAKLGDDLTAALGVTKYTPPVKGQPTTIGKIKNRRSRRILHTQFSKYTNIEPGQKHGWILEQLAAATPGFEVAAHCKMHGTSARYGWLRKTDLWSRLKEWVGFGPQYVFLLGSRNVDMYKDEEQIVHHSLPANVYKQICDAYDMPNRIPHGFCVYGEIIGEGIQPGYSYGLRAGEPQFLVYDVQYEGRWLSDWRLDAFCKEYGFHRVPCVYRGPYSLEKALEVAQGPDAYAPNAQPVREGVVIRPREEAVAHGARVIFKFVNPGFLLSKAAEDEVPDTADTE